MFPDCRYRGPKIGEHESECCPKGHMRHVYECTHPEISGPCILRHWTLSTAKREASGETCCNTCERRQSA